MEVKELDEKMKQFQSMQYAALKKSIVQDLLNARNESAIFRRYPKSKVVEMLEAPQKYEESIREMSRYVYDMSIHYKRLVDYISYILLYNYNVVPFNVFPHMDKNKFRADFLNIINKCNKYSFKQEAPKAIKTAVRDGVFFGLEYESRDSYYIKPLEPKYCKISGIEDGTYTYSFDLNYFVGKKEFLVSYGTDFINAWDRYKGNEELGIEPDKTKRWFEIKRGIVVKADESDPFYSLPYFTGLLLDIFSIEDYKMLKKAKAETDNYKAIGLEVPTNEDGEPLMDYPTISQYYAHAVDNISNPGVGVFVTPFKINSLSFASSKTADTDDVLEAERAFWMASGVTSLLFADSKANSSSSILLSVKPDEQIAYSMLLQLQRHYNKKIKKMNLDYDFQIEFTRQSIFNEQTLIDNLSKASQYGLPTKLAYASAIGISPSAAIALTFLEEDVLGLSSDNWKQPLVSSNTQSSASDDTGGRPTQEESGKPVSDSTETGRENDGNNKDNV